MKYCIIQIMTKKVILTGIRANNDLHIGNYFGALLPLAEMAKKHADDYQINLFLPDLHSFTTPVDHDKLRSQSVHNLRTFVAAGLPLDHDDIFIYRQSYIPAHSELTVILNNFTGMGQMSRMTQYKDKSSKLGDDQISVGLFDYPVLMAADILLYNANYVPVGDDQTQHLEFTRDIAERINSRFGEIFVLPEAVAKQKEFFATTLGRETGLRIKDLLDPAKKMSKSSEVDKGSIFMTEDPVEAAKKIMSATTDSVGAVHFDPEKQPGISNLLQILALLRGVPLDDVVSEFDGLERYGDFKKVVAEEMRVFLEDYQKRVMAVNDSELLAKLESSESAMNETAKNTLSRIQKAVGLR